MADSNKSVQMSEFLGLTTPEWQAVGTFLAVIAAVTSPFVMHHLEMWRKKERDRQSAEAALMAIAWDLQDIRMLMRGLIDHGGGAPEEFKKLSKYLVQNTLQASSGSDFETLDTTVALLEKLDNEVATVFVNFLGSRRKVLKGLRGYWDLQGIADEDRKSVV